jgi:hypothetical protein|nr:MAG TPA: FeoA [Caudoviricetes sp.]
MRESENQDGKRVRVCALTDEEEMAHAFRKAGFNGGDLDAIVRIIQIFKNECGVRMDLSPNDRMKRAYRFVGAFYGWL